MRERLSRDQPALNLPGHAISQSAANPYHNVSDLIDAGIRLQSEQYVHSSICSKSHLKRHRVRLREDIKVMSEQGQAGTELKLRREKLRSDIGTWHDHVAAVYPILLDQIDNDPDLTAENALICLPSALPKPKDSKDSKDLEAVRDIELQIRKGEACDVLGDLRYAILVKNALFCSKKNQKSSVQTRTRSEWFIEDARRQVCMHASLYQNSYQAMLSLGLPTDDPAYKPLTNKDLKTKNASQDRQLGDGSKVDSWIWGPIGELNDEERSEWEIDCACQLIVTSCFSTEYA